MKAPPDIYSNCPQLKGQLLRSQSIEESSQPTLKAELPGTGGQGRKGLKHITLVRESRNMKLMRGKGGAWQESEPRLGFS